MTKPETRIQNAIQDYVNDNGGNCFKLHGNHMQRRGEPDIVGSLPFTKNSGWFIHFYAEVKVPGEEEEELQAERLENWAKQGYACSVVSSLDDFKTFMVWAWKNRIGLSKRNSKAVWRYYEK